MSNPTRHEASPFWGIIVGCWFLLMLFTGGVTNGSATLVSLQSFASALLLLFAVWRLRSRDINGLSKIAWITLLVGILYVAVQMIPLPASIWTTLPGRDLAKTTLDLVGSELPQMPLSLMASQTAGALIALIPALAGFVAALSLKSRDVVFVALAIIAGAIISSCFGLFQKTGQVPDWLYFYTEPGSRLASGFFRNRNYLAALLFASLPFLAVVATALQRQFRLHAILVLAFILTYMAIMLAGLAAIGSRGGTLLAMPAVLLTIFFVYKMPPEINRIGRSSLAALSVLGVIFIIAQVSMVGILRLAETDPLEDFRTTIIDITWTATKAFWPVGSGFGSFVNVYQIYETPDAIIDRYVNAAHNDWLQILLEGGAVAAVLLGMFVLLYISGVIRTLKFNLVADEYSTAIRAGLVTTLLLSLHAFFDFGLRTPALLSLFSLSCGIVCLSGRYDMGRQKAPLKNNQTPKIQPQNLGAQSEARPKKQYFKTTPVEPPT